MAGGIVFDIKRGSIKDGPGLRTSVFLKGCPLRCVWCHNPESQAAAPQRALTTGELCGRTMTVDEVMEEVRRDAVFYAASGGGVTFTGGEPTAQAAFLKDLCAAAKAEGVHVAVDTCGYASWAQFAELLPLVDLFLYDVKGVDPARHRALTGVDNALILDNLRRLDAAGAQLWIRYPLVPGLNDSEADLAAMADLRSHLTNVRRVEICPYHSIGLEKYGKFGIPARYPQKDPPAPRVVDKWKAWLSQSSCDIMAKTI